MPTAATIWVSCPRSSPRRGTRTSCWARAGIFPDGRTTLTPVQRFGNALSTTLIRIGWGFRYSDLGPLPTRSGRRALDEIRMRDRSWGWTLEMQVRAIENKLRIVELPVTPLPRSAGKYKISGSIVGSLRAGFVIISMLIRLYVRREV